MKDLILITGASSGIGYEMAKLLAAKQYNLILVARSADKLENLKTELQSTYGVTIHTFVIDLAKKENAKELYEQVKNKGLEVTMLVNNAGSGIYGNFTEIPLEEEIKMIDLNISSVVILTKLFVQDMIKRNSGKIMNIASILSFLPFPYYSVYSATKSFILAFTETLTAELEDTGVIVTALCPGPTDTAFNTTAMLNTNAYKANKPVKASVVAKAGVDLLLNGKGKKIVGFRTWFITNLPRITPDKIMMKIKKNLATQRA